MSKYIVFKCLGCGKANIQEVRLNYTDPSKIRLYCKFCPKTFMFRKTEIYNICAHPNDATELMKSINLDKEVPMEYAKLIKKFSNNLFDIEVKEMKKPKKRTQITFVKEVLSNGVISEKKLLNIMQNEFQISEVEFDDFIESLYNKCLIYQPTNKDIGWIK